MKFLKDAILGSIVAGLVFMLVAAIILLLTIMLYIIHSQLGPILGTDGAIGVTVILGASILTGIMYAMYRAIYREQDSK